MRGICSLGRVENKLGNAALAAWLLLPLVVLIALKTDFLPQFAHLGETAFTKVSDEKALTTKAADVTGQHVPSLDLESTKSLENTALVPENSSVTDFDAKAPPPISRLNSEVNSTAGASLSADPEEMEAKISTSPTNSNEHNQILAMNGTKDSTLINSDVATPRSKLSCDFSQALTDICVMHGDVRIHGTASTVFVVSPSEYEPENATAKLRPYPRKWEETTMQLVREVTINSTPGPAQAPPCTATHDVPAVVFSSGGYSVNFFHAMNDVIIPLYITAHEYNGKVLLLATNYDAKWMSKYQEVLARLSNYPVIDVDADPSVRCFPSAHVGLECHKVLGIDPLKSRNGYTMPGFRDFLRSAYSLERPSVTRIDKSSGKKPRLVMVLRRKSRALTNEEEVVAMATSVGFEVVAAGPEQARDVGRFARVVNSCDVLMGVHGAGLTNMVFLPNNGTVIQIVPWGAMKWASWYDYGEPEEGMRLKYAEYEIIAEETTLIHRYPMDHPVFTDPVSIHHQGFNMLWATFLNGQNVTLDVRRFRGVLEQVYQSITE